MMSEARTEPMQEIAIIGMAGRFPGARNVEEFWKNLCQGVDAITEFSEEELLEAGVDPALLRDPHYVKAGAVLEGCDRFDAAFFGYTPREAEVMDPQHRVFLEVAWEALERSGYVAESFPGLISVFAAAGMNRYLLRNLAPNRELVDALGETQLMVGNDKDFLATRVAYKLNLRGAAVNVQTACSSSLVAIHMACQSLLNMECDMALAGGVTIGVPQKQGYLYQEGGIASPDGRTRTFDAKAQGTVFGSGCGVVVLKRLEDALADGDTIYAVVKGSAVNNDGSQKVSFTAPSVEGQMAAIAEALAVSGVEPETVSYIEAHGTATPLGDPIEIAALTEVFRAETDATGFCAIGSVKSNVGHLDMAAGVAGVIKTALALHHRLLPPSLHYERPNPQIDFANSPFYVNTKLQKWKAEGPLRAGVSSFGFGGTNAHAVLEEAPPQEPSDEAREWQVLVLSAKTETALEAATERLQAHLEQHPDVSLADSAYTLQVGRKAFAYRRMLVCRDVQEAVQLLKTRDPKRVFSGFSEAERPVAFLFSGTGSQYVQMARELYEKETVFREVADECFGIVKRKMGLDLREVVYPQSGREEESAAKLNRTMFAQPALFVIEYALARQLMAWGVEPQRMIGHSLGEYVAAALAGVFTLEDALTVVCRRAQLIQSLPGGAMLAVPLSEEEVQPWLDESVALAAVNGPKQCVLSGTTEAIERLEGSLKSQGVMAQRVHATHAFHSPMMEPILEEFSRVVQGVKLQEPKLPFVSNVTGRWITAAEATDPAYWVRHLRQTVRFADGLRELCRDVEAVLVEIGPGRALSSLALQMKEELGPTQGGVSVLTSIRHVRETQSDVAYLLQALGRMWLAGVRVDWEAFHEGARRLRVLLPTYPFESQRYWVEAPNRGLAESAGDGVSAQQLEQKNPEKWFYLPVWKQAQGPQRLHPEAWVKEAGQNWLVFADDLGAAKQLVQRLQELGHSVTTVRVGEAFLQLSEAEFALNPACEQDYAELLRQLAEAERLPNRVLHLWCLTGDKWSALEGGSGSHTGETDLADSCAQDGEERFKRFQAWQQTGFYSLLNLAKALAAQEERSPVELWVVADGLHEVESADEIVPEKATLLGLCKVIPQEVSHIECRVIDAPLPKRGSDGQRWVEQVLAEVAARSVDRVVAYRGKRRWVLAYEGMTTDAANKQPTRLRAGGVYAIAGAFGKIGSAVAAYLAQQVKAKLLLLGRTELPARVEWDAWLAEHEADDPVSVRIRQVQALEEQGAQVLVMAADVKDEGQMRRALAEAEEQFGALHGVVYAAGGTDAQYVADISSISKAQCEANFAAKAHGLFVLERVLRGKAIDFCLIVSSLSSVLGGIGCAAYAAAHTFVDAFAQQQNRAGDCPWLTVNWDRKELDDTEEVLGRALSLDGATSFVMSRNELSMSLKRWVTFELKEDLAQSKGDATAAHLRPNLQTAYAEPTNETEKIIAEIMQELLGIDRVGIHDSFFELGGNSLIGTRLIARLRSEFEVDLPLQTLFEASTVAELAVAVETKLIAEILEMSSEE
jgi:acyl transferase domain-containing protein/acyl carrier protein